jgi:hypothetical protein
MTSNRARPLALNTDERGRLAVLRRRRDHLTNLIANYDGDPSWALAERSALTWAIERIETAATIKGVVDK